MTFRARPIALRRRRSPQQDERRQQLIVSIGFVALLLAALGVLVGAVGASYYNDHLANVATVDGTGISRDQWNDRQKVDRFRVQYLIGQLDAAQAAGLIDANTAGQEVQHLRQQLQSAGTMALSELVDQALQAKLAAQRGITVTNAEVDAALKKESTTAERRKVLLIAVAPTLAAGESVATDAEEQAAQGTAGRALAELQAGTAFADVAKQYSTDATSAAGGDLGYLTASDASQDAAFVKAVFALPPNGTTGVIAGADGTFRIGRVTDIVPQKVDAAYQSRIAQLVSLDAYRAAVRGDVIRAKLQARVTADATAGLVDQVHAWEIRITTTDAQGQSILGPEVRASHILYSPKGDSSAAAQVPATDPSWGQSKARAAATAAKLRAIADPAQRAAAFAALAKSDSNDSGSAASGGDLGWFDTGTMAQPFNNAVFTGAHQPDEIIGPVRTAIGWDVILFVAEQAAQQDRVQAVETALAQPNADFATIARQNSDASDAESGGDMGWIAHYQIDAPTEKILFGLKPGMVSAPIVQSDATYFYRVSEARKRAVDATQLTALRSGAWDAWYADQKAKATIWESPDVTGTAAA